MAPTNFSNARNNHRAIPLPRLLKLFAIADISSDAKIEVLEWIAFKQELSLYPQKKSNTAKRPTARRAK